jgi:hypothetical protein
LNAAIRTGLKHLSQSALGRSLVGSGVETFARDLTNIDPQRYLTPDFTETISDAFLFRASGGYRTRFDLINIPSLLFPEEAPADRVTIVFFSAAGAETSRTTVDLEPFEMRPLFLDELVGDGQEFGIFSLFHELQETTDSWSLKTCLSERSYVSYSKDEGLWSYVHGCCNSRVFSREPGHNDLRHLCRRALRKQTFCPQLRFDDCDWFELSFTNPLTTPTDLEITVLDDSGQIVTRRSDHFAPLQTRMLVFEEALGRMVTVYHQSNVFAWRPLIFKHYASHFDALHA